MYEEGIKHFRRAIINAPGLNQWPATLAMILSEVGRIDEALIYARELTDMNPDDGPTWATRSMIESLVGNYSPSALEYANRAVELDTTGFNENLALAFALSGSGHNEGAIGALKQIVGEKDDIYYRCLGHFEVLDNDFHSAVDSLRMAVDFTKPAKRPKILALYGVALLAQGSQEKAREIFESANSARDSGRRYKADDELAFALCELGAGQTKSGVSKIEKLSNEYPQMRGLFSETSALLSVMRNYGIDGCDQCISALDTPNS